MKDIEWLKREVKKLEDKANKRNQFGSEYTDEEVALENVVLLLSQLDEPEVLSQKWIDEHTEHHEYIGYAGVPVYDLQNLLVQKRNKPVIPQFVADSIERQIKFGHEDVFISMTRQFIFPSSEIKNMGIRNFELEEVTE